jgi:hypothetical protein
VLDNLIESAGPTICSLEEQEEMAKKKIEHARELDILERYLITKIKLCR